MNNEGSFIVYKRMFANWRGNILHFISNTDMRQQWQFFLIYRTRYSDEIEDKPSLYHILAIVHFHLLVCTSITYIFCANRMDWYFLIHNKNKNIKDGRTEKQTKQRIV